MQGWMGGGRREEGPFPASTDSAEDREMSLRCEQVAPPLPHP